MKSIIDIANTINGAIEGDSKLTIKGVCDLKDSQPDHISYVIPGPNENYFKTTKAAAVLVSNDFNIDRKKITLIRVHNPALCFIDVIDMFSTKIINKGIHNTATISSSCQIGKNVFIGPNVVIEKDVKIGNSVYIGSGTYIGSNCIIGNNTTLFSNINIYHNITIGKNCILDSGSVIGSDGFGLVSDNGKYYKMPHIGGVVIENDVWIGSNCCIDRGTLNNTIIAKGTKLDNLIQIAHNVKIGKNCRISGQTAIAGSTVLGDNVTIAGQVGIIDHLTIGNNSIIAAKSAVFESIKPDSIVSGNPARPHKNRLRQEVVINQLPEVLNRIRKIEKKISTSKG